MSEPRALPLEGTSTTLPRNQDRSFSLSTITSRWTEKKPWKSGRMRHTLGIILLLVTVVLWTTSNFLASTIFADNTYSKPYFVTYVNTAFFIIPLVPMFLRQMYYDRNSLSLKQLLGRKVGKYTLIKDGEEEETDSFLSSDENRGGSRRRASSSASIAADHARRTSYESVRITSDPLTIGETAKLSLEFCMIWFLANYFTAACLEYTTVASSTILTSTSSIWTLLVGSLVGVERFTLRKLFGVLASLAGIILISGVDISGSTDKNRGNFPHKTTKEIAIGDALAFLSAVLYGFYAVLMKRRIGDEGRVNMPLFFGLVGLFNVLLLWPGFILLHVLKIETFEMPPAGRVVTIVIVNSITSLISDICWAYAMLLTSPLVVTVGLSLTIPLSLVGQMILESQYSSAMYWFGAGIVFLSFIFVNHEETKEEAIQQTDIDEHEARLT